MFYICGNNWNFLTEEKRNELERIQQEIKEMPVDLGPAPPYGDYGHYFPYGENVLRFLHMDFSTLKYVIMGMEPYPTAEWDRETGRCIPEATGRSFEVASLKGKTWASKFKQSSLRNILKTIYLNETGQKKSLAEIREEIESGSFVISDPTDWFDHMEEQGVLFLNASLTVQPYKVGSHRKQWEGFMTDLIDFISKNSEAKWLLWGNDAKTRVGDAVPAEKCIISCHPRLAEFVDMNCFQYADKVNWKV